MKKCLIIYFSQTGNTKQIALAIAEGIKGQGWDCDVRRIKEVEPADWLNYDLVGIGSCVWSSCPIPNVIYHIKALPDSVKGRHAFFYCTHGTMPGRCLIRGVQPMLDKGLTVLGWRDWFCSASLRGHAKPWYSDGHPDEIDLAEARAFGDAMARHSVRVAAGETNIIPKLHSKQASDEIYGVGHPLPAPPEMLAEPETEPNVLPFPTTMDYVCDLEGQPRQKPHADGSTLVIDADKCIGCHRCVQACWCYNIDGSTTPPSFRTQKCEQCYYCEGVCPTGAIRIIEGPAPGGELQKPGGSLGLSVDLAEATGRFRRIIPEDQVGFGTPWEAATGHPRHKIIP